MTLSRLPWLPGSVIFAENYSVRFIELTGELEAKKAGKKEHGIHKSEGDVRAVWDDKAGTAQLAGNNSGFLEKTRFF